jgi:dephospho-CoA kinase
MTENHKISNPFASFNASFMDDDVVLKYWTQPQVLFEQQAIGIDLTGNIPVVLMGGRGTGKTMLLKYMSNEIQIKQYIKEKSNARDFLQNDNYLAVYYRFDGPSLSNFNNRNVSDAAWDVIFKHYFELIIGQKYMLMLQNLKENGCLEIEVIDEEKLASRIFKLFSEGQTNRGNCNFAFLFEWLQNKQYEVDDFVNNAPLRCNIEFQSKPIPSGRLIFGIPKLLQESLLNFKYKNILVMFDEYENLTEHQQKIINTLIKHTKIPVSFRIGTRINGFKTYDTLNENEFLMEDADYRKILFEDILTSSKKEYKQLLKQIAEKRLNEEPILKRNGFTDIEQILESVTNESEALQIVTKSRNKPHIQEIKKNLEHKNAESMLPMLLYPENPLIEMLNLLLLRRNETPQRIVNMMTKYIKGENDEDYKKYKDLYSKNKLALLFQLVSLYRPQKKSYAGFDMFSMLSSGIIRNFLELCYQSFNLGLFFDSDRLLEEGKISIDHQTDGAVIRAGKFFENIERISTYGNEIKSLVWNLGAIFYSLQMDPRLKEPEPTYFSIDTTSLSEDERKVLGAAVQWSVLQKKEPMKSRSPIMPLRDVYVLNRILSPKFSLSHRTRGRPSESEFSSEDIHILIWGSEKDAKCAIKRLTGEKGKNRNQMELWDYGGFETGG